MLNALLGDMRPAAVRSGNSGADNGGAFRAIETHTLAHELGIKPVHTPVNSPQSNGMAKSFVNPSKRDYVGCMDRSSGAALLANFPTHSGTSTKSILIRRWGTNRHACLEKSDAVRLWKLTLTKHQAVSGNSGAGSH